MKWWLIECVTLMAGIGLFLLAPWVAVVVVPVVVLALGVRRAKRDE